jgi:hypothetical protein
MNSNHTNRPAADSWHLEAAPRGLKEAQVAKQIKDAGTRRRNPLAPRLLNSITSARPRRTRERVSMSSSYVNASEREQSTRAELMFRMRTLACVALSGALALLLFATVASSAQAAFGIEPGSFKVTALNRDGSTDTQAGSHPYSFTVSFALNQNASNEPDGNLRDAEAILPPGLIGDPLAPPTCPRQDFETVAEPVCSADTQLALLHAVVYGTGSIVTPVYNMDPPPGSAARFGAAAASLNVLQDATVLPESGYSVAVNTANIPTPGIEAVSETVWGVPADPGHDPERGKNCINNGQPCPLASRAADKAFLTLPTSCGAPLETTIRVDSREEPGIFGPGREATALSRDAAGNPAGLTGCSLVPFSPAITAASTTRLAANPSGLDFELKLPDVGLESPEGIAESQPEKVEVALPQGVTINPSAAEGIAACTEAQYQAEQLETAPGAGCPQASKIGSVNVHTPLLEEIEEGSVYLAAPHENQFHSLLALYIIARAKQSGVLLKLAGKVEADPRTGQLISTFENLPPIPFSSFHLHFREGGRAQLVTPPTCGTYQTAARLTPFSAPDQPVTRTASFTIDHGADGGACPSGGTPPFHPGLLAGTTNNAAGHYSPFYLRLTRTDAEQEFTHFSIKLPPGLTAKLAGLPFCPEAGIAQARVREREGGGAEELAAPSCPKASEVGHTLVGAGVGGVLTYVPGKLYLAGPYHGSALSVVAITAAKVGPFDLGTVVIRQALKVNPETAEVFVDATGSDPIPHIVDGIPVHARDVRVYVDRPEFTLNPTGCEPTSTASTALGSGLDFVSEADDVPFTATSPFQAADCAALPFKPKLSLTLKGSTKRGGNPALRAHLAMNGIGEAGLAYAQVALPPNIFLDNAHIGTVCTRVIFKEGATEGEKCPSGSLIGHAKALTPLLSEPLEGPIYLRSNPERELPDIAASLHGQEINIVAVGHTDSAPGGGLRNTFEVVPDAPITSVDIDLLGGKRGLLENAPSGNATSICQTKNYATLKLKGHNGKLSDHRAPLKASGCKKHKKHHRHRAAG